MAPSRRSLDQSPLRVVGGTPDLEIIRPDCWHVCIGGHFQDFTEPTGIDQVWLTLGRLRNPRTCVVLRPWNADWTGFADLIHRVSPQTATIRVYAYSHGAGWGFIHLAQELGDRGFEIRSAVLADPIYWSRWYSLCWRMFLQTTVIRVPRSVHGRVWWTRQRGRFPFGHDLVAEDPHRTDIQPPLERQLRHAFMDEDQAFQRRCFQVAGIVPKEE